MPAAKNGKKLLILKSNYWLLKSRNVLTLHNYGKFLILQMYYVLCLMAKHFFNSGRENVEISRVMYSWYFHAKGSQMSQVNVNKKKKRADYNNPTRVISVVKFRGANCKANQLTNFVN